MRLKEEEQGGGDRKKMPLSVPCPVSSRFQCRDYFWCVLFGSYLVALPCFPARRLLDLKIKGRSDFARLLCLFLVCAHVFRWGGCFLYDGLDVLLLSLYQESVDDGYGWRC